MRALTDREMPVVITKMPTTRMTILFTISFVICIASPLWGCIYALRREAEQIMYGSVDCRPWEPLHI